MSTSPEATPQTAVKTAVSYARVSTKEQAERNGDPEGYSLPAQLDANRRKAAAINAMVVEEFVERGESAKSADTRPELQRMGLLHDQVTVSVTRPDWPVWS